MHDGTIHCLSHFTDRSQDSSIIDLHPSFYITLNPGVVVSGLVEDTVSKLATVFQAMGRGLAAGQ